MQLIICSFDTEGISLVRVLHIRAKAVTLCIGTPHGCEAWNSMFVLSNEHAGMLVIFIQGSLLDHVVHNLLVNLPIGDQVCQDMLERLSFRWQFEWSSKDLLLIAHPKGCF